MVRVEEARCSLREPHPAQVVRNTCFPQGNPTQLRPPPAARGPTHRTDWINPAWGLQARHCHFPIDGRQRLLMSTLKESVHLEGGTRRTAKFRTTCGRRKVTATATLTVRASTATSRLTAMVQASLHGRTKTNFPPQETWAGGKCWTPGITPRKQLKRPKKHPIARTSTVLQTQPPANTHPPRPQNRWRQKLPTSGCTPTPGPRGAIVNPTPHGSRMCGPSLWICSCPHPLFFKDTRLFFIHCPRLLLSTPAHLEPQLSPFTSSKTVHEVK